MNSSPTGDRISLGPKNGLASHVSSSHNYSQTPSVNITAT